MKPYAELVPIAGKLMESGAELPAVSGVDPTGDGSEVQTPTIGGGAGDLSKEFTFQDAVGYDTGFDLWD